MKLTDTRPYHVGLRTTLYYLDENYRVQSMVITKEMVERGSIKLPKLPYSQADYELYIKDNQVFADRVGGIIVTYTETETGEVHEPFACNFLAWNLRTIFRNLGKVLRAKVKRESKERYPLVAFVDAETSEILVEIPLNDYYTEHKGLLELEKVSKRNSDCVIKTYDKEMDEWILFELRRLRYWKALDDIKGQVQAEIERWKEDV